MNSILFWKDWTSEYRKVFVSFAILLAVTVVSFLIAFFTSPSPSINWDVIQQEERIEIPVHQVQTGPYSIQLSGDSFVLFERFLGSEFNFLRWPSYFFLMVLTSALALLLSIKSTLSRFWFFIGSGLLIFMITGMRLETLAVFGSAYRVPTIFFLVVLVGIGLLFQYYFQNAAFYKRLLTYGLLLSGLFSGMCFFAKAPEPVLFLAVGLVPATTILTILFTLLVAHEILAGIIFLISKGMKGSNGFSHFLILSAIYLINLGAVYLHDLRWFSWDYSVSPVLLIGISGILAIWGIRRQGTQLEGFLSAEPFGVFLILCLGLITFAGLVFFYTTSNDSILNTIRDLSLYIHIGYGLIFVTYVVANFSAMLTKNLPVYRVLYQPTVMPFFTFRFGGLIATLAFVLYNIWQRPLNDSIGGYYNAMADYYHMAGQNILSTGYYKRAARYAFNNHHSNYILAQQEAAQYNTSKEKQYYRNAIERRPLEQTYLNLANISQMEDRPLDAYLDLDEGIRKIPSGGFIKNTLGIVHFKLNAIDSAIWYFDQAAKSPSTKRSAEINKLAVLALRDLNLSADSVYRIYKNSGEVAVANALSFANRRKKMIKDDLPLPSDTLFSFASATILNNYILNHRDSLKENEIEKIEKWITRPANADYLESLIFSLGLAAYETGLVNKAFNFLQRAAYISENKGKYNNIMAAWAMEQGAAEEAVKYISFAMQQSYPQAQLTQAVILTEAGKIAEAVISWDSLKHHPDKKIANLAEMSLRILIIDHSLIDELSEEEKYSYCRYRLGIGDSILFQKTIAKIKDNDLRCRAILDFTRKLYKNDHITQAIKTFRLLEGIPLSNEKLYHEIQLQELLMLAVRGEFRLLALQINKGFNFSLADKNEKIYFTALLSLGDSSKAKHHFEWLASNNSFFEEGIVAASSYFKMNSKENLKAYTTLAYALHANPLSVKILKAYIVESANQEFHNYSYNALTTLKEILSAQDYREFVGKLTAENK